MTSASNAVLHPWLRAELTQILQELPEAAPCGTDAPFLPYWWQRRQELADRYNDPPVRLILIWDNLAGHKSPELVPWLCHQGILPLYTPLRGSWLNRAEALQRIVVRRAVEGQHPQTAIEIITWLEDTVAGGNEEPTPFAWDDKRRARRQRARQRRLGGAAAVAGDPSDSVGGRPPGRGDGKRSAWRSAHFGGCAPLSAVVC